MRKFIEDLDKYPPRFGRSSVEDLFPGMLTGKTLAELACRGEGPPFTKLRRRVVYERQSFLEWLDEQAK